MSDKKKATHPIQDDPRVQALLQRDRKHDAEARRLASVAECLSLMPAGEAGSIGYLARAFIACALPHRDPKSQIYTRTNGPYCLTLLSSRGVPYGKIPRVFLAWLQTEVVRRGERTICVGQTLGEAVGNMGLAEGGTTFAAASRQIHRATSTTYEAVFEDRRSRRELRFVLAPEAEYRYDPHKPNQTELWSPTITINEALAHELLAGGGVPFDWRVLRALRSPLAIDLYLLVTHTTHRIRSFKDPLRISIRYMHRSLGSGYPGTQQGLKDFQKALVRAARQLRAIWPEIPLDFARGELIIAQGRPHVRPTKAYLPPST